MKRKRYTEEQIAFALRQHESARWVLLSRRSAAGAGPVARPHAAAPVSILVASGYACRRS